MRYIITIWILLSCQITFSKDTKAIIIADSVNIREKPTLNSKVISKLSKNSIVDIIDISINKEVNSKSERYCDYHNFVKIKTKDSIIGWVYGLYVYKIIEEYNSLCKGTNKTYQIFDKQLKLVIINNSYNEEKDAEGATYCDHIHFLMFIDESNGLIKLIKLISDKPVPNLEYKYLSLNLSNGGNEKITDLAIDGDKIVLKFHGEYLDNETDYDVFVEKDSNGNLIARFTNKRIKEF